MPLLAGEYDVGLPPRNAAEYAGLFEHATDTHGVTLVNFGLFDLLGLQLSPRSRDLGGSLCTGRARVPKRRLGFRTLARC